MAKWFNDLNKLASIRYKIHVATLLNFELCLLFSELLKSNCNFTFQKCFNLQMDFEEISLKGKAWFSCYISFCLCININSNILKSSQWAQLWFNIYFSSKGDWNQSYTYLASSKFVNPVKVRDRGSVNQTSQMVSWLSEIRMLYSLIWALGDKINQHLIWR